MHRELLLMHPIVRRCPGPELPLSESEAVAQRGRQFLVGLREQPDSGAAGDRGEYGFDTIGRAIIDDNQLEIGIRLVPARCRSTRPGVPPVCRREVPRSTRPGTHGKSATAGGSLPGISGGGSRRRGAVKRCHVAMQEC